MFIFTFNFITIKHVVLPVSLAKQEKEEEEQCSQPPFSWLLYLHTYVVIKII